MPAPQGKLRLHVMIEPHAGPTGSDVAVRTGRAIGTAMGIVCSMARIAILWRGGPGVVGPVAGLASGCSVAAIQGEAGA